MPGCVQGAKLIYNDMQHDYIFENLSKIDKLIDRKSIYRSIYVDFRKNNAGFVLPKGPKLIQNDMQHDYIRAFVNSISI